MEQILHYFPNLSEKQKEQFSQLMPLYSEWNERINVISRKDVDNLYERHVLHSLGAAMFIDFLPGTRILDIGTGGGFPLIPMAILFPEVEFWGVDGVAKKIRVVNEIATAIGLQNIIARPIRAEEMPKQHFDFVCCRAVTTIDKLVGWSDPLLAKSHRHTKRNGLLALKGGDLTEELTLISPRNFEKMGLQTWFSEPFFEWKSLVYVPK